MAKPKPADNRLARAALIGALAASMLAASVGAGAPRSHRPTKPTKGSAAGSGSATGSANGSGSGSGSDSSASVGSAASGSASDANAGSGSAATAATGTAMSAGSGSAAAEPEAIGPDVDALRQEYLALRDELFKSRARANAVASALYSTRVTLKLTWTSGRFYAVSKASIRLDGASVFDDATGAIATDDGVRFDGFVAPGRHVVTFHVDATGKDDDSFTSSTETQVVVKAVANKDLLVAAKAHDGGDIAYQWKRDEHGSYGLGIDIAVKAAPRVDAGGGKK